MSVHSDLLRLSAPKRVLEAGAQIDAYTTMGIRAPYELVLLVRGWATRARSNDRYGR